MLATITRSHIECRVGSRLCDSSGVREGGADCANAAQSAARDEHQRIRTAPQRRTRHRCSFAIVIIYLFRLTMFLFGSGDGGSIDAAVANELVSIVSFSLARLC
jgi:hypothetical protein